MIIYFEGAACVAAARVLRALLRARRAQQERLCDAPRRHRVPRVHCGCPTCCCVAAVEVAVAVEVVDVDVGVSVLEFSKACMALRSAAHALRGVLHRDAVDDDLCEQRRGSLR